MEKKVYKLKKPVKLFILFIILFTIGAYFGNKYYQDYLYKHSNTYYLLELGYSESDVNILTSKLSEDEQKNIIDRGYNEFIPSFVNEKYFMFKNLDKYLDQVVTKDEDFFNYVGVDGYDYSNIVAIVNVHQDETQYTGDYKTNIDDNYALLVNKHYYLGDYTPDDLVNIEWKYRYGGENDIYQIRSDVYNAFIEMWNAAYSDGIYLLILSGYRSYADQEKEYNYYYNLRGTTYADSIAAHPGYSEHQTGLALDIYSKECSSQNDFENSNTYKWLIDNSYKYGFILRYPKGKEKITGYNYESWHFRYVGKELAEKVHDLGLTYDEYYAYYLEK